MRNKNYIITLFILASFNFYAQSKILTGSKHMILLEIPKNWVQVENDQTPFLIKPDHEKSDDNTYMYVYGLDYQSEPDLNLWIEGNNSPLKNEIPEVKIGELNFSFENLKKDNFLTGRYKIVNYIYPNLKEEALLVIEAKTTIITAVLAAKDHAEFDKYLNSFKELVNSMKINAAKVTYK